MKISSLLSSGVKNDGPHHQIVISSRIRLARNLKGHPFPGWGKKSDRLQVLELVKPEVENLPEMGDAYSAYLQDLSQLEKQVLVERHLISREHAAKGVGSAVVINKKQNLSIMINEEDHLRMQVIRSGLQLKSAFRQIDKVDSALEARIDYAFHPKLGYLTACPTNVGTGMRASAMIHLPALVLSDQINQAREKALEAVMDKIDIPLPESAVNAEIEARKHNLEHQIAESGLSRDAFFRLYSTTEEERLREFEENAKKAIKAGFLLDKIVKQEEIGVAEEELTQFVVRRAMELGVAPNTLAKHLADNDQLGLAMVEIVREKAKTVLGDAAKVVDENGNEVDLKAIYAELNAEAQGQSADQSAGEGESQKGDE